MESEVLSCKAIRMDRTGHGQTDGESIEETKQTIETPSSAFVGDPERTLDERMFDGKLYNAGVLGYHH